VEAFHDNPIQREPTALGTRDRVAMIALGFRESRPDGAWTMGGSVGSDGAVAAI
jgi:hypothetical protein